MSSQPNNQDSGMGLALGLIGAGLLIFGVFIFALASFAALIWTVLCFFAWNKPIGVFGETLTPMEARRFVRNGVMGVCLTFFFLVFVGLLFGFRINDDYFFYALIAGYVLGAFIPEKIIADQEAAAAQAARLLPPLNPTPPSQPPASFLPPAPFRFASWDDEEERR